ncbi:hypothetical protein C0992_006523 [Termitomyces sp. T32_za158]|nr:hypothetical protein C0992_006523 [Termitomyces sp. T32_za158]
MSRVDKYGRPLTDNHEKDNLKRFYRLDNDVDDTVVPPTDYARGDVLLESSSEEDDDEYIQGGSDDDKGLLGRPNNRDTAHDDSIVEINLDETEFADLDAQAAAYTRANPDPEHEEVNPSHRLAVVNLDWDHVRAVHLFKICASVLSVTASSEREKGMKGSIARGKVLCVRVYPSEFGKERMAREEKEGPPPEIFRTKSNDDEEVNAQNIYDVGEQDEYDKDALRNYQLERLRYYYAIITCDTADTAIHIYQELEGTELERSANVFNLSYVPDDMTFDSEFRDEATQDTDIMFKNLDFVTDALRHSKVKLTWDEDDPERNYVTRRTLTKKEIDDGDFKAFLASSSESESEVLDKSSKTKKDKKQSRDKLRALLLDDNEDLPEGWDHDKSQEDIDMEITFTPGLSEQKEDETTLEKYQRKMKEKRKKRKEEVKTKASKAEGDEENDDFFDIESEVEEKSKPPVPNGKSRQGKAFTPPTRHVSTPEELALLVASDNPHAETQHFDMKSVIKAEKKARRKGKKKKNDTKDEGDNEIQTNFKIDVNDERFNVLHEDHHYAIDPTNPQFRKTVAMGEFLKERSRRNADDTKASTDTSQPRNRNGETLKSLVESVKRKSDATHRTGKRRKVKD